MGRKERTKEEKDLEGGVHGRSDPFHSQFFAGEEGKEEASWHPGESKGLDLEASGPFLYRKV